MRLTDSLQSVFRSASDDSNPLHCDPEYARRTPFGRCIVFGMAACLKSLGFWASGRSFSLRKIRGEFIRPLLLGVEYDLLASGTNPVTVKVMKGSIAQAVFEWDWNESFGEDYTSLSDSFVPLLSECALKPRQMPVGQLKALLWASFQVGMKTPGKQALFSSFEFEFRDDPGVEFEISRLDTQINPDFRQWLVVGEGAGIKSFELEAFERPFPVSFDYARIADGPAFPNLAKKNIFITGAGRGFGSVLACAAAPSSPNLYLNFRTLHFEANELCRTLSGKGLRVVKLIGDIGDAEICSEITRQFSDPFIDYLVLNATGSVRPGYFCEDGSNEWLNGVRQSLRLIVHPLHQFLPFMKSEGIICLVSSVFSESAPKEFGAYTAAKLAGEGLVRTLVKEHPRLRFVIARLPTMATDLSNATIPLRSQASPISLAVELLGRFDSSKSDGLIETTLSGKCW